MENTWEYNRVKIEFGHHQELITELDNLGADGWEIVHYEEKKPEKFGDKFESIVLFKKEKTCNQEKM